MANELYIYTTPATAHVQLALDTGVVLVGQGPITAHGRADAHVIQLPAGTLGQGAVLEVSAEGYADFANRGLLLPSTVGDAHFELDDVRLAAVDAAPTPPDPTPPGPDAGAPEGPEEIIDAVYATGAHDLSTHEGCGQFTEACCEALHDQDSELWGHIRKDPGQNQYNGHAVDAVYLLAGEGAGVYDIIHDSVSPNASPQCIWKDAGNPELWYYPLDTVLLTARRRGPHVRSET